MGAGAEVGSVEVSIGTSSVGFVDGLDSTAVSWGFLCEGTYVRGRFVIGER